MLRRLLLLALFACLATVTLGATDLPLESECGNGDSCARPALCVRNKCQDGTLAEAMTEGTGNRCSADDCCPNDLECSPEGDDGAFCVPPNPLTRVLLCGGGIREPGQNTTEPIPDPSDDGIAKDQFCDNGERCRTGLVCFQNKCVDPLGDAATYPNGYGNACSATNCCAIGQLCLQSSNSCSPTALGVLDTIECQGEQPPAVGDLIDAQDPDNAAAGVKISAVGMCMMLIAAIAMATFM